jgi:anti-sigma factor RsiW
MSKAEASSEYHLSLDLLTRSLDEELSSAERFEVELHLTTCEVCRKEAERLGRASAAFESFVEVTAASNMSDSAQRKHRLQVALEAAVEHEAIPTPGKVMRRFGWGISIAATLAFGILVAPRHDIAPVAKPKAAVVSEAQLSAATTQPASIEVDGESFTPLPYSNPDLPVGEEHIVQMQVPVSSLADVGIELEPVVSRMNRSEDSSVLADVLVGYDGQPRGVHVLGSEQ